MGVGRDLVSQESLTGAHGHDGGGGVGTQATALDAVGDLASRAQVLPGGIEAEDARPALLRPFADQVIGDRVEDVHRAGVVRDGHDRARPPVGTTGLEVGAVRGQMQGQCVSRQPGPMPSAGDDRGQVCISPGACEDLAEWALLPVATALLLFGGFSFAAGAWRYLHIARKLTDARMPQVPPLLVIAASAVLVLCTLVVLASVLLG